MRDSTEPENLYFSVFDHAGTAMMILEEDLTISAMNREAESLTGYCREETAGRLPWNTMIDASDGVAHSLPAVPDFFETCRTYEARLTCRNGQAKHVLIKVRGLPKTGKTVACLIDISRNKETDKALQNKEEKYRNILQNIDEGYFEVDLQGNLIFFSDSLCRITGYSREELLGMNNRRYTSPETAERMYHIFNQVYRTGVSAKVTDYDIVKKDGETCFLAISASLIKDPEGKPTGFCGLVRDISERKKHELALQESESKLRHLIKHAPAGIYEIDFLTRSFITVNEVMCEFTGYTREELLSMDPLEILTEQSRARFIERFSKLFTGENVPEPLEYQIQRKDGKAIWVVLYAGFTYERGIPRGATVVAHDITERRSAEEALRKSEERYRLLVEHASEGIFITQDMAIKFPNPKAREILGYPAEELASARLTDLLHPQDIPLIEKLHQQRTFSTLRLRNKAGEELWLELNAVPIIWEDAPAFLYLFRDVTLQKKLEAQLLLSQKMEAIGTLAGGIAHNFNNLLMAIQGNVTLMFLDTDPKSPHSHRLTVVENLIESGSRLTSQLLGYARGGKHEFRPTDLNRLAEETSRTFGLARKEIEIHLDLSPDVSHITADRSQIEEVLMNLFVNAADAMPEGGDLFVTTRNVTEKALRGKPFKVEPGRYVLIEVRDTGSGMDKRIMSRIFDPFFTTKPPGRGTGLGLASAYGIVKSHKGYIDADSEEGAGACFFVYLPCSENRETLPAPEPIKPIHGVETLLLVDDEETVLTVAQLMLEKLGYRVMAAKCGKEAIDLFSSSKDPVDLVILDMVMPDMGGGILYEKLKEVNPRIKTLLSSGYSIDGQAMEIMKKGCNGFIQKPFSLADLSTKVRSILDGSAS